jgi:GDPmannose 4,6-dehydratase
MDAKRDWGYAKDYVEMMWLMLQQEQGGDYVAATGETHSVREFVELTSQIAGFDLRWEGEGVNEVGRDVKTGEVIVRVNPDYYRPAEVDLLLGDPSKAKNELGWESKVKFAELAEMMIKADLALLQ